MSSSASDSLLSADVNGTSDLAEAIHEYYKLMPKFDKSMDSINWIRYRLEKAHLAYQQMFSRRDFTSWSKSEIEHFLQQCENIKMWLQENVNHEKKLNELLNLAATVYIRNILVLLEKLNADEMEEMIDRLMELKNDQPHRGGVGGEAWQGVDNVPRMVPEPLPTCRRYRRHSV